MAYTASDKKEKTLGEVIIVVLILAILMMTFMTYFFKRSDDMSHAGFSALANVFMSRVNGMHAQWFMDKKPSLLKLKEGITNSVKKHDNDDVNYDGSMPSKVRYNHVPLNKKGWVDISANIDLDGIPRCEMIWHHVIQAPLVFMKEPIIAIEVLKKKHLKGKVSYTSIVCQYRIENGNFFEYNSENGKVSRVHKTSS